MNYFLNVSFSGKGGEDSGMCWIQIWVEFSQWGLLQSRCWMRFFFMGPSSGCFVFHKWSWKLVLGGSSQAVPSWQFFSISWQCFYPRNLNNSRKWVYANSLPRQSMWKIGQLQKQNFAANGRAPSGSSAWKVVCVAFSILVYKDF